MIKWYSPCHACFPWGVALHKYPVSASNIVISLCITAALGGLYTKSSFLYEPSTFPPVLT